LNDTTERWFFVPDTTQRAAVPDSGETSAYRLLADAKWPRICDNQAAKTRPEASWSRGLTV